MKRLRTTTRHTRPPIPKVSLRVDSGDGQDQLIDFARSNHPVEYIALTTLKELTRRTRVHPEAQIERLIVGIRAFGFIVPILIDAEDRIICGVARVEAARRLGMYSIPALRVTHLSAAMLKAFRLFENRISEDANWVLNRAGFAGGRFV